ncbi:hypothetical protein [Azospirillum doebereinerae]
MFFRRRGALPAVRPQRRPEPVQRPWAVAFRGCDGQPVVAASIP